MNKFTKKQKSDMAEVLRMAKPFLATSNRSTKTPYICYALGDGIDIWAKKDNQLWTDRYNDLADAVDNVAKVIMERINPCSYVDWWLERNVSEFLKLPPGKRA